MAFKEGTPQQRGGMNSCELQLLLPWYGKLNEGMRQASWYSDSRSDIGADTYALAYLTGAGDDQCVRIDSLADRLSLFQCSPSKMITGKFLKVGTWSLDTMSTAEMPSWTHLAQSVRFLSGSPTTKACHGLWGGLPLKKQDVSGINFG